MTEPYASHDASEIEPVKEEPYSSSAASCMYVVASRTCRRCQSDDNPALSCQITTFWMSPKLEPLTCTHRRTGRKRKLGYEALIGHMT